MGFTGNECTQMRQDLKREFKLIGEKLGVDFDFTRMSYGEDIRFKLFITKKGQTGASDAPVSDIEDAFKRNASAYGLEASDFGRTFRSQGSQMKIVGAKPNYRKYPIIVQGSRGGKYKMSPEQVRNCLGK